MAKDKYINKYIKNYENDKFRYFTHTSFNIIEKEFTIIIDNLKEIDNIINSLNISNIHKLNSLNNIIKLIERKAGLLKFNEQIDKYIVDKIINKYNINIETQIKNILLQLDKVVGFIKSIINYLELYLNDNDLKLIEYIKKEIKIYYPNNELFNKYKNNNKEYFISENENDIIPYYFIQNDKIFGCDEIKYDIGICNLNDSEFQYIYIATLNNNINIHELHKGNDVKIEKRNKIIIFKVKIKKKKEEKIEEVKTEGSFKFEIQENGKYKIINYQISYQLEPLKLYIKCDKYKLKYLGQSTFLLNSPILFKDETIFFVIKNLSINSENAENNFKLNITSYEDNKCSKPIKNKEKDGFSLEIKNESNSENNLLSFLLTVIICRRFQFYIKICSHVKQLDFDFLISRNPKGGFLNKQIYCPFEENDSYDFILYVATSQERINKLKIEKIYDENLIEMTDIKKIEFFCSIKYIINIRLLKKVETNIKLKAMIENKKKEINIIFTTENNSKNYGYKYIDNNITKKVNSEFFAFNFNEITAHGIENEDNQNFLLDNKLKKKPGFINLNQFHNIQILKFNQIDTNINININGLCNFYHRISEEARLLPIYYLKYKNEKQYSENQILLRKNYYFLEEIYNSLDLNDIEENTFFYEENYFYEEIKEFINSFNYMTSILEIHDKEMDELINKIQKYIENNKDTLDPKDESLKLLYEKIKSFKNARRLSDYMKKFGINLYDLENDSEEKNNCNKNERKITEEEKQSLISTNRNRNSNTNLNDFNKIQNHEINKIDNNSQIKKNLLKNDNIRNDENKTINTINNPNNSKIIDKNDFQDIKNDDDLIKVSSENKEIHIKKNIDNNEEINANDINKKKLQENSIHYINKDNSENSIIKNESLNNNNNLINSEDLINNLLNIFKNPKFNLNFSKKISNINNEKASIYVKQSQDVWKQNEKNKGVFTERNNINRDNYFDDYLNDQTDFQTKIISEKGKKINTLEQIKKEIKSRNKSINYMKNNTTKKYHEKLEPNIGLVNFNKNTYFLDKESIEPKKNIFGLDLDLDDNDEEEDESNDSQKIIDIVKNNKTKVLRPSDKNANCMEKNYDDLKNKNIKFEFSFEDNDGYFSEFDEELIQNIISNIKEREEEVKEETYEIKIKKPLIPKSLSKQNNNKNENRNDFITKNLLIFSKNYMEKCLELITKSNLNFVKISICFIIDCSLYLSIKNKLLNLIIILSIIKVLYIIDIEFSILLSADDMYKVIIKNYDDDICYEDLIEILYETIIIKRFRNNVLKALKTSIDYLKNEKRNTVYFVFFDYMDESFTYPYYWINNILIDRTNSFFLIPEKSRLYQEKNKDTINQMIKLFQEKIQKNSSSKIKILDLNYPNSDIDSKFNFIFSEFSSFLNDINELNTSLNNEKNDNKKNIKEDIKNLTKKNIEYFKDLIKDDFYNKYNKIYFFNKIRQKPKINIQVPSFAKPNIEIPNCDIKNSPEIEQLINSLKNSFQDKTLIESIFYPNKATHKQLSTKGTEIDILALILYTMQPLQEPMIYLENKGGLIRDYSITVIIDNSKSCFSEFNDKHSFLTMINLFNIIHSMAIPSFDLIVTANKGDQPNILVFDKPSNKIYYIFEKLLTILINPILKPDLSEAIKVVYELKKKKRNDRDSYLFILTDGLSHMNEEQSIKYFSYLCENLGIKIFAIGIGIFPYQAQKLFDTFIYSANPNNLLRAISKIFGKMIKTENELELISDNQKIWNLDDIFNEIEKNNIFYFEELRKELQDIEKGDDINDIFKNTEKKIFDDIPFIENAENLEIYTKNLLKTQKILMVMLWSFDLNKKSESPYVSPKFINTPSKINGNVSIQKAISHFGIENVIVLDYESAIEELLKKNEKGECLYYSVWIFCGPQYAVFPQKNGAKNLSNPHLVEEFINILIEFWNNGGALVFMAEGEPLNFQVNLFLEKVEFSKNQKLKFRIHGNYIGNNYLKQDKEGKMDKAGIFNKSNHKIIYKGKEIQRQSLSHNLGQIYEGYTISYVVDKNNKKISFNEHEKVSPFKIFGINSEGGISTLIYEADSSDRGDIIIDCGYTKCFVNMYRSGTYRFIQNIAGWTARPEIKFYAENKKPCDWRPKGIKHKVNYDAKYNGFLKIENEDFDLSNMKTLFCIDNSGSTRASFYYDELKEIIFNYYDKNRGDIFYLWNENKKKITYKELEKQIESKNGCGDTYPCLIADIIEEEKNNECRHLMIITDGCVSPEKIEEADNKIKNIKYNFDYVTVYILGEDADLSIGAPFCRNTPNKTFSKKGPDDDLKEEITLSKEDIETLENLEEYSNYEKFINNYDKISKAVQAKCIGTSDENLKKKLIKMFDQIIKSNRIDVDFIESKKKMLIGMTEGFIKNSFTLDKIKAATYNLKK